MNLRQIYVALVPVWLANALERRGLPLETAADFTKLANTLSCDDVCFYVNYLQNAKHYVGDLFNDMQCISRSDENSMWIEKNQIKLAGVRSQTQRFFTDEQSLIGNHVPTTVRKTNYVAQALPEKNCLAIVGRENTGPLNSAQLADESVSELAKLMTNEELIRFNVFKAFTQTAA